jgi:transcriptional regulator with XRE-family HTH domain
MKSLRQARHDAGLTLAEASARARIAIGSLSQYERGLIVPRPPIREVIARVLGVPEEELLWGAPLNP